MNTGVHQYFTPTTQLPGHKDIGTGAVATHEATEVWSMCWKASQPTER